MAENREIFDLVDRLKKLEVEQYRIGADMHDIMRRMPKLSLARLSKFLATQFTFRSARYFKAHYNIYVHFILKSGLSIDDIVGIDYRILRSIAESRVGVFDIQTTRLLLGKLEGDFINRQSAWQLINETKSRRIKELQHAEKKNKSGI